jgi:flagellar protein FliL
MAESEEVVTPQGQEAPKKGKSKLWLILGGVLLLLVSIGFVSRNYLMSGRTGSDSAGTSKAIEKVKSTMNLDSFLVNLADQDATRFIKVTFRLGIDETKLGDELKDNPVVLAATRDTIISCLSTKTADELLSPEGKEKLKREVREQVNKVLPKGKVVEVYIMDFVVQM